MIARAFVVGTFAGYVVVVRFKVIMLMCEFMPS